MIFDGHDALRARFKYSLYINSNVWGYWCSLNISTGPPLVNHTQVKTVSAGLRAETVVDGLPRAHRSFPKYGA